MARSNNNNKLPAFVRFDGSGRIISSSLIVQAFKPAVGNYVEIDAKECCNYTTTTTTTVAPTTTTSTTSAPVYSFLVRRNNTGPCQSQPFTTIYSNSNVLAGGVSVYNDINLTSPISVFTHICDCVNSIDYTVLVGNTLSPGVLSICITTTTTTTPAP